MAEYKYEFVKVRIRDGIAWASLNRPDKRNAMSPQLHYDMDDALRRLETDEDVRVVVVTGEGGNFSAGQDLQKFFRELERNPEERKKAAAAANRWRWERLYGYDKPTIAMVHGYCVGGAFMQLLGCDFAIAAEDATFSLSEVNWGILPGALVSKVVADALLPRHALYYACMGDAFDGKEAARIGLINFAVPKDKLEDAVTDLAERLMKKSPAVLRATKHVMKHVRTMDVPQAYDYLAAKGQAIRVADKEDSYNTGLRQFLDEKSYKPTYEPFKLGTMLTDQRRK
jgi:trans-feruloyl-CoA hydratase/vanillin synthase